MFDTSRLKERVSELEDEVAGLKREFKGLELEWEQMYDKFRTLLARLNKRAEREEKGPEAPRTDEPADPRQLSLTPEADRLAKLNEQIRKNRRPSALPAI